MVKLITILLAFFFPLKAYSHGGGLNKQGCHNNRSTGDYHCHRGNSSNPQN